MNFGHTSGQNQKVNLSSHFVFALFYSGATNGHNRSSKNGVAAWGDFPAAKIPIVPPNESSI